MYQISYINSYGDDIVVCLKARSEKHALRRFRAKIGYYTVTDITKIN